MSTLTAPGSKTWDYDYNALGQPTQVSLPNGMTTVYTYDTRNRLTSIAHKDGSTVLDGWTYSLDDEGNITRTDQADGSYCWTGGYQASSEQVGSDASIRRTYIGGLAHFDTATASDSTYRYYGADHLGSTRALWESDGDLASAYEYGPYGTAYADFGPGTTHRYTGHLWESAAGLHLAPYRAYAPDLARWLSREPFSVDGPNLYTYALGSPVVYVDPNGLWGVQWGDRMIGIGNPWLAWDPRIEGSLAGELGRGVASAADGFLPFVDPLEGFYRGPSG